MGLYQLQPNKSPVLTPCPLMLCWSCEAVPLPRKALLKPSGTAEDSEDVLVSLGSYNLQVWSWLMG